MTYWDRLKEKKQNKTKIRFCFVTIRRLKEKLSQEVRGSDETPLIKFDGVKNPENDIERSRSKGKPKVSLNKRVISCCFKLLI